MPRTAAALILFVAAIGAQGDVRWHTAELAIDGQRWTIDTRWRVRSVENGPRTVDARVVRVRRSAPDCDTAKPTAAFLAEVRPLLDAACTLVIDADGTITSIDAPKLARHDSVLRPALREGLVTARRVPQNVRIALRPVGKEVLCTFDDAWVGPIPGAEKRLLAWIKDRQRMLGKRTMSIEIAPEWGIAHKHIIDVLDQCMAAEVTEVTFVGLEPSSAPPRGTITGSAPPGADVRLGEVKPTSLVEVDRVAVGPDGVFRFADVEPATWHLRASWTTTPTDLHLAHRSVVAIAGEPVDVGLLASGPGTITVRVDAGEEVEHAGFAKVDLFIVKRGAYDLVVPIGKPIRIHGVGATGRIHLVASPTTDPLTTGGWTRVRLPAEGVQRITIGERGVVERRTRLISFEGVPARTEVRIAAARLDEPGQVQRKVRVGSATLHVLPGRYAVFAVAGDRTFHGEADWSADGTDHFVLREGARITVQSVRTNGKPSRPPMMIFFRVGARGTWVGGGVDENGEVTFVAPAGIPLGGSARNDGIGPFPPGTHRVRVINRRPIIRHL